MKGPKKGEQASKAAKKAADKAGGARTNKKSEVTTLVRRPLLGSRGATLAEIMAATGWQKHTVRGFVSILGKKGEVNTESSKNSAGERVYKIAQ